VSRLCDRVTRRASPGLDTDLSGLGSGFIYPGNVKRKRLFSGHAFHVARVTVRSHIDMLRSVTLCDKDRSVPSPVPRFPAPVGTSRRETSWDPQAAKPLAY
jgi:hypothetical protein